MKIKFLSFLTLVSNHESFQIINRFSELSGRVYRHQYKKALVVVGVSCVRKSRNTFGNSFHFTFQVEENIHPFSFVSTSDSNTKRKRNKT